MPAAVFPLCLLDHDRVQSRRAEFLCRVLKRADAGRIILSAARRSSAFRVTIALAPIIVSELFREKRLPTP
jgi:hypothetical protein